MTDTIIPGLNTGGESGQSVAYLDATHWSRLLSDEPGDVVLQSWLALQAAQIPNATRGVLVSRRGGPFRPVAFWPENGRTSKFLMSAVNDALAQNLDVVREDPDGGEGVAIVRLVRSGGKPVALIGVELGQVDEKARQSALRSLQWGSAWLEVFERRRTEKENDVAIDRLALALDTLAVAGEHKGFRSAAAAALTQLAIDMRAARISFGLKRGRSCRVLAISNTTRFDKRVEQVRTIARAMDEAVDQNARIDVPHDPEASAVVRRRAEALSEARGNGTTIVQSFARDGRPVGAIVFEWSGKEPPAEHLKDAVGDVTALLAPLLDDKYREDRWLLPRAWDSLKRGFVAVFGAGHAGLKASLLIALAVIAFFAWFTTDFRVAADARLRGAVERVVAAPLDGYILEAPFRAGDRVAQGALLVQFDDVEYRLERFAWTARQLQFRTEYAQALAAQDRARTNMLKARIEEAEAQIRLNDTRIALARVEAPFEAVIVSGNLSQSLGQSIQRGEEMFRIAPLSDYVVEVSVPESDVLEVRAGAEGSLVLTSLPDTRLGLRVDRVTPVTRTGEGVNTFLVEATLSNPDAAPVAPGMEGIAKIEAGERKLIWIWTRRVADWARLMWWRWSP